MRSHCEIISRWHIRGLVGYLPIYTERGYVYWRDMKDFHAVGVINVGLKKPKAQSSPLKIDHFMLSSLRSMLF